MTEIWKFTDDFENVYNINRCKNDFNIACREFFSPTADNPAQFCFYAFSVDLL